MGRKADRANDIADGIAHAIVWAFGGLVGLAIVGGVVWLVTSGSVVVIP